MRLILALLVMDLMLVLIFGILVSLFEGVITLWLVPRAGLECLVAAIRRSLVLLFLLALIIVVVASAVVVTLPLVVLTTIHPALPAVVAVTPVTLIHNMVELLLLRAVNALS